jgi:hypothetical protein
MKKPLDIECGRLQVSAGLALLEDSRLLEWRDRTHRFEPVPRDVFEYSWRKDVHPVFGRLICWVSFSSGAELLLKGVCFLRGIDPRTENEVPCYPMGDLEVWVADYLKDWKSHGTIFATHFSTLGTFTISKSGPSLTDQLCVASSASPGDRDLLVASYKLLQFSIRNRDVHAYVPNVRDSHFHLVPELFSRALNTLASWIPGGPSTLTAWRRDAADFVASQ